ncbi:MAG: hypothetical protein ACE5GJ_00660 [Gemmatimonadota bacterium]
MRFQPEPVPGGPDESHAAVQAVGRAIQDLMAVRLGRGFIPLGLIALVAALRWLLFGAAAGGAVILMAGAILSAIAMLSFGLEVVQRAFRRSQRPWMTLAAVGSVVPPLFGVYVAGWSGLRVVALGAGVVDRGMAAVLTLLGLWTLRRWLQVVEVKGLATAMDGIGGVADTKGGWA